MKRNIRHKYKSWNFQRYFFYIDYYKLVGETPLDALIRHYRRRRSYKTLILHFSYYQGHIYCDVTLYHMMQSKTQEKWRLPPQYKKKNWRFWEDIKIEL